MNFDFLLTPIGRKSEPDAKSLLFNFTFSGSKPNKKNAPPLFGGNKRRRRGRVERPQRTQQTTVWDESGEDSTLSVEDDSKNSKSTRFGRQKLNKRTRILRNRSEKSRRHFHQESSDSACENDVHFVNGHPSASGRNINDFENTSTVSGEDDHDDTQVSNAEKEDSSPSRRASPRKRRQQAKSKSVTEPISDEPQPSSSNSKKVKLDATGAPNRQPRIIQAHSPSKKNVDSEDFVTSPKPPRPKKTVPNNASNSASVATGANQKSPLSSNSSRKLNVTSSSSVEDEVNTNTNDVFVIEENRLGYKELVNSHFDNNEVVVPLSIRNNVAGFMLPTFTESNSIEEYPGIFRTMSNQVCEAMKVGFIKIQGKTVMPTTFLGPGCIMYWVIEGNIKFKSAGGNYEKSGQNFLFGKNFSAGACVVVRPNTLYTIENWSCQDVLLSYCLVTPENSASSF